MLPPDVQKDRETENHTQNPQRKIMKPLALSTQTTKRRLASALRIQPRWLVTFPCSHLGSKQSLLISSMLKQTLKTA